jgi:hypothetical protein
MEKVELEMPGFENDQQQRNEDWNNYGASQEQ